MIEISKSEPAASLIVVNFNGAASIGACVESLLQDTTIPLQVIVVDNASGDESAQALRKLRSRYPSIEIIRSAVNRGYAGAVNLALPSCRARYVGVLNMDLVAEPNWIVPLIEFLQAHPRVGAVNPLLTLSDGRTINATGQNLHVTGLGFNRGLGRPREEAGLLPFRIDGLQGAAFLVRRDLLTSIGGMDESGFLYHEDVNLSWMIRLSDYDIYCVPRSVVRHDYFLSMHAEKLFLLERNRWMLLLTTLRPSSLLFLSPMLVLTEFMLWGYALLRGPAFVRAKARTYAALWRGRKQRPVRRTLVQRLRKTGDLRLIRHFSIAYAWRQFAVLAAERGAPRRPFGLKSVR